MLDASKQIVKSKLCDGLGIAFISLTTLISLFSKFANLSIMLNRHSTRKKQDSNKIGGFSYIQNLVVGPNLLQGSVVVDQRHNEIPESTSKTENKNNNFGNFAKCRQLVSELVKTEEYFATLLESTVKIFIPIHFGLEKESLLEIQNCFDGLHFYSIPRVIKNKKRRKSSLAFLTDFGEKKANFSRNGSRRGSILAENGMTNEGNSSSMEVGL